MKLAWMAERLAGAQYAIDKTLILSSFVLLSNSLGVLFLFMCLIRVTQMFRRFRLRGMCRERAVGVATISISAMAEGFDIPANKHPNLSVPDGTAYKACRDRANWVPQIGV
jgi:hypothetical protein